MRYAALYLPLLACGAVISSNELQNSKHNNELMFRKLKTFENSARLLPHNVNLNGAIEKKKRDSEDDPHFDLESTDLKVKSSNPKTFEKASPILEICIKGEHLIENASDLHNLQVQCEDVSGDIRFIGYGNPIVDFGNLHTVGGSVYLENISSIVKIQGNKLEKIGETFSLRSLTSLVSIDMPSLREVKQIEWQVVPILNSAYLSNQMNGLKKITISDSSLAAIEDFSKIVEVDIFDINNNRFLEIIKANIETVHQKLSIHANAKQLELEMPKLVSAQNITIRDTSLVSLPKLETVGSSLELIENDFREIELPTLRSIGGSLGIIDNENLDLIDFSNVRDIQGGLIIANNSKMQKIDSFGKLKQIGGGIYFEGRFSETNFPQLKLVKGSAYVKTDSDMLDCSKWTTPKHGRSFIRGGKISCISGKNEESESVDTDGNILDKSENKLKEGSPSNSGAKQGLFSKISHSGGVINEISKVMWTLIVGTTAAFFI